MAGSLTPAGKAWAALAAGVFAWEIYAADGQLLSEEVDRWLVSHPVVTRAVIAVMAMHLANALPARFDVVSILFNLIRGISGYCNRLVRVTRSA